MGCDCARAPGVAEKGSGSLLVCVCVGGGGEASLDKKQKAAAHTQNSVASCSTLGLWRVTAGPARADKLCCFALRPCFVSPSKVWQTYTSKGETKSDRGFLSEFISCPCGELAGKEKTSGLKI